MFLKQTSTAIMTALSDNLWNTEVVWAQVNCESWKKLVIHENKEALLSNWIVCATELDGGVNSPPHAPATLYPEKEPLVPTE